MKKIRALQNYTDTLLNKNIVKGEEYIVDDERARIITSVVYNGKNLAQIIEEDNSTIKIVDSKKSKKKSNG